MYVEWVKRGGAQGGCVDVGGGESQFPFAS